MYRTTKETCQSLIDKSPIVCCSCGGPLSPIETVDNANNPTFWRGCTKCQKFDKGTTIKIYNTACKMVDERNYKAYDKYDAVPNKETHPEDFEYWRNDQIGGTIFVIEDILNIYNS